jgi:signal transduction histidine kinase
MLLSRARENTEQVLYSLVHLLPEGWQHPENACARVVLEDMEVATENFTETEWIQSADVRIGEEVRGKLEVGYLVEYEHLEEGPFLHEERSLLETVTMELGSFLEYKRIDRLKQQQHKELEIYASLLRHDLRNDVAVIVGNIEIFRMVNPNPDEVMAEIIQSTEAVCERMMGTLSTFGRSAKMAQIYIAPLVSDVASKSREVYTNLTISIRMDRNAETFRIPESKLLPMVFDNLFRNAVQHGGSSPTVDVSISKKKRMVEVVVSDDGPGVSDKIRDRLFEKGASTRGGGLGLYLSRVIIETMGGSIDLDDSQKGRGATFRILIPLQV